MSTLTMRLDAVFQSARQYIEEGRIGSAVDSYKLLIEEGDYRGIEGLVRLREMSEDSAVNGHWKDYLNPIIGNFKRDYRPIKATMAMYPPGFSFSGLIDSMEERFGSVESCRGVLDAMRTADWSHPYIAYKELVKVAGSPEKNSERKALMNSIGKKLRLDENAISFFGVASL